MAADPLRTDETEEGEPADPLREKLLEAAAQVFAAKGYEGTKVLDIVKASGLSTGAMYPRFSSKNELLIEAVVRNTVRNASRGADDERPIADLITRFAVERQGQLSDSEAMQLEAYTAARREPEVAEAIVEARKRWRAALEPLIEKALSDGTLASQAPVDTILYFLQTVNLGLLVQRGAGLGPPDLAEWEEIIGLLMHAVGRAASPP